MSKITIQQGIYLLSTLSNKENELLAEINNYKVPLSVNGKDVTDKKQSKEMIEVIETIKVLQKDMIKLKVALARANADITDEGKSINELLEEAKRKRRYLNTINYLSKGSYTKVENGVGVVQYGVLNAEVIKNEVKEIELEVSRLSQRIDMINSANYIEIELSSNY